MLINSWKRRPIGNRASALSGKTIQAQTNQGIAIKKLHAKIGQSLAERDFLQRATGR